MLKELGELIGEGSRPGAKGRGFRAGSERVWPGVFLARLAWMLGDGGVLLAVGVLVGAGVCVVAEVERKRGKKKAVEDA